MHWSDKVKNDALAVSLDAVIAFEVNKKGYTSWLGETKLHRHLFGDLSINFNIPQKKNGGGGGGEEKTNLLKYPESF